MSTKTEGKQFTQDPTFPRGIVRFLQIKEKLAVLKCSRDIMLLGKKWISRGTESVEPELERRWTLYVFQDPNQAFRHHSLQQLTEIRDQRNWTEVPRQQVILDRLKKQSRNTITVGCSFSYPSCRLVYHPPVSTQETLLRLGLSLPPPAPFSPNCWP